MREESIRLGKEAIKVGEFVKAITRFNTVFDLSPLHQELTMCNTLVEIATNFEQYKTSISEGCRLFHDKRYKEANEKCGKAQESLYKVFVRPDLKLLKELNINEHDYDREYKTLEENIGKELRKVKEQIKDAQDKYKEGKRLSSYSEYEEALERFEEAYKASENTSIEGLGLQEIKCLKKVINIKGNVINSILNGKTYEQREEYKLAIEQYKYASELHLQILTDPELGGIFISLHNGDTSKYEVSNPVAPQKIQELYTRIELIENIRIQRDLEVDYVGNIMSSDSDSDDYLSL